MLELREDAGLLVLPRAGGPTLRTLIRPPCGRIGPLTEAERKALIEKSPYFGKYEDALERDSAYEKLSKRAEETAAAAEEAKKRAEADKNSWGNVIFGKGPRGGSSMGEQIARDVSRSVMRSIITSLKNVIIKSIFKR